MTDQDVINTGKALKFRGLLGRLWKQLRIERPRLAWDTVNRAFLESELLTESSVFPAIREAGRLMLLEDDARISAENAKRHEEHLSAQT